MSDTERRQRASALMRLMHVWDKPSAHSSITYRNAMVGDEMVLELTVYHDGHRAEVVEVSPERRAAILSLLDSQ